MSARPGFLAEMKRRHVWRVAAAYAVVGWLLIQVVTQVFPVFNIPGWGVRLPVVLVVCGFPVAVLLAWVYELTPSGIRRTAPVDSLEARDERDTRGAGRKLDVVIIVALAIAVALLLANTFLWHEGMRFGTTAKRPAIEAGLNAAPAKSIAVLPFENLSDDKDNAYFVAGMQDLILTRLAGIGSLKVISQTSTTNYGSHPRNLKQVAAELGVATVLEGSVQKHDNQVLISVQLIDAKSDQHLWAQSYTRTLDNLFGVEGEVAEKIAVALDAKLSPAQNARLADWPTTDSVALDLFLRAQYQANRGEIDGDLESWKAAIPLYREAVARDAKFALAWARLSYVESRLAFAGGGGLDVAGLNRQARADAERAATLQPGLAAAQLALGYCDYYGRRDYGAALQAFAAALAARPNDADALSAQGYVLRRQGRFDEAIASLTHAVSLDPRHFATTLELGNTYMMLSRYDQAETWLQHALALEPDSIAAKARIADAIVMGSGDVPRALAAAQGDAPQLLMQRAELLAYQRNFPAAIALLQGIPDTPENFDGGSRATDLARRYWQAGDMARARELFAQALSHDRSQLPGLRGMALANAWARVAIGEIGTGHIPDGLAALAKARAVAGNTPDAIVAPAYMVFDAAVFAMADRADLAVPLVSKALTSPGAGFSYSPVLLWLDPVWDPIRSNPGFQALLRQYANYKPQVTYDNRPASASSP